MKDMKYSDKIHLVGRAGSVMSLCIMLGIPALICAVYDIWPTIGEVVSIGSGLLAIFVPTAISEVFSYTPILGSACYIAFITGNVLNLKLPCAVSRNGTGGCGPGFGGRRRHFHRCHRSFFHAHHGGNCTGRCTAGSPAAHSAAARCTDCHHLYAPGSVRQHVFRYDHQQERR